MLDATETRPEAPTSALNYQPRGMHFKQEKRVIESRRAQHAGSFDKSKISLQTNQLPTQPFKYIFISEGKLRLYIISTRDRKDTILTD